MCRFGYDYAGGYEREMGGRPGFPEERPHGRYMGRAGGYQSGPSGTCLIALRLLHFTYEMIRLILKYLIFPRPTLNDV